MTGKVRRKPNKIKEKGCICEVCYNIAWADFPTKNYKPREKGNTNHIMLGEQWYACEFCKLIELYNELIMAVGNKYKGETRHETALKYIKRAEAVNGLQLSKTVIEEV